MNRYLQLPISNTFLRSFSLLSLLSFLILLAGCNKDDVIESAPKPEIVFDNSDGVYLIKVDEPLTLAPLFKNIEADDAVEWTENGTLLSTARTLTVSYPEEGTHYITVKASGRGGTTTEDIRVEVSDLLAPEISLPFSGDKVRVALGTTFFIQPEYSNTQTDGLGADWYIDGECVSSELTFSFEATEMGDYYFEIRARNQDGETSREFTVTVVDKLSTKLTFLPVSYNYSSTDRYTFPGRPVFLRPLYLNENGVLANATGARWSWFVDGKPTDCNDQTFIFNPDGPGTYTLSVQINDEDMATVKVVCVDATESERRRTGGTVLTQNRVFEYVPAPGQFIGDTKSGGMTGKETTPESATIWAEQRLRDNNYISLGAFGGYVVVGFDHSIPAGTEGYDFYVNGNAFLNHGSNDGGSNEPGIVYVMQDVNGNGLPDDEWYELRGSETGKAGTIVDYAVTYYRPAGPRMNILWTDNCGESGTVDYLSSYHSQESYFPTWISDDAYTLWGTRLKARTWFDDRLGIWNNPPFNWGYANNMGSDSTSGDQDGTGQMNGFKISNAIYPDGSPVSLQYIDFIMVKTAVQSKAGWIGEVSTEVLGFKAVR